MIYSGILLLVLAGMVYFRVAPTTPEQWHKPISAAQSEDRPGGAIRVVRTVPGALALADHAMMAEPRTSRIAGSVAEGRVTYVSRSRVFGFPDYTTIEQDGDTLRMQARLRFGRSDFGVNRARLERVLDRVEAG